MYKIIGILLLSILPCLLLAWYNRTFFTAMAKDIRLFRILHYVLVSILGGVLFYRSSPFPLSAEILLTFIPFFLALFYAAIFAIVSNNIEDEACDRITNKNRPLVQNTVNRTHYQAVGYSCQAIALLIALLTGFHAFIGISLISLGYFSYSCKPFKFKRYVFFAKAIIGFNSLVMAVTGFVMAGGTLIHFPPDWALFFFLSFSLASNFVDLKDTEGDRVAGVSTLPVRYGEKNARKIIALFTMLSYVVAALLLNIPWVYPLNLLLGIAHVSLLYKEPYQEKPVFLIYLSSIAGLTILLLV